MTDFIDRVNSAGTVTAIGLLAAAAAFGYLLGTVL